MERGWIDCKDELPPLEVPVLGYYAGGNWLVGDKRLLCKVVYRKFQLPEANDTKDYRWITFGPTKYFSHDISHWKEFDTPNI